MKMHKQAQESPLFLREMVTKEKVSKRGRMEE